MENLNSSIFKPYQKYECWRGEKQTILRNSIGRQLPYIVNFKKNTCQIFDIEWERITHSFSFPEGCNLIDVDYFPTKEGQLGILVGVEDPVQSWGAEHFVVALSARKDIPTMRITHSADVQMKITVVKTLFSAVDMAENVKKEKLNLYHRLMDWPHVVAIGCRQTQCHLSRLSPVGEYEGPAVPIHDEKRYMINLMAAFTNGPVLQYTIDDGSFRDYPAGAVSVTALALMPRSRTLLVGLSMGGILSASLNPSNQMMFLELRHERLIRNIAPLEPEDDPDKFEYFIVTVDASPRHPIMIQLWRGSFKTLEQVDEAAKYDRPFFNVCLEHKILFGERWVACNPIVIQRDVVPRRRGNDESMINSSHTFGSSSDRSSVFLAYERKKLILGVPEDPNQLPMYEVEASIFDIDAWYYKRVPGRVSTDKTVLKQCPFLSTIKSDISSDVVSDIGILTSDFTDINRFSSTISDADQLFYPSALSFDRVMVAKKTGIDWMKIQNLQETIINKCAAKLPFYFASPEEIAEVIVGAGLIRKNILSGSPNSSISQVRNKITGLSAHQIVVLCIIAYYGKIDEFCNLATLETITAQKRKEILFWAINECLDYKASISDKTLALFQGKTAELSPVAEASICQGIKLFRVVYEYSKVISKTVKENQLRNYGLSVKCVLQHTKLSYQFINFDLVPVDKQRHLRIKEFHEENKTKAMKNKTALPIQSLIRNMHRLDSKAQFWNDVSQEEWYPPTPLDLLEVILNVHFSERIKRELVIQYVLDWIRSAEDYDPLPERELAMQTIRIMTNQFLELDLEKIYFVLDQEKKALTGDAKKSEEVKLLGEKVFSMQDGELSYDKMWDGDMGATIGKQDMERFEQRLKTQMEGGGSYRLPVLDPESEMLYQVYLFENEKYEFMSKEAVKSNKLLSMFLPGMIKKKTGKIQMKSSKEKEIENSVKTMFERQSQKDEEQKAQVFAKITVQNLRKRNFEEAESSSAPFVPPSVKRLQPLKPAAHPSPAPPPPSTSSANNSSITSQTSMTDSEHFTNINLLIATPAKYYKRPMNEEELEAEFLSPTSRRAPPPPTQNSILKTAKAAQSASKGRIRFHESVPRGADESLEVKEKPKGLALNFAILEDEEEEETMTSRKSRTIEHQEKEKEKDEEVEKEEEEEECIEKEKSFEQQEDDFEVLEDKSNPESESPEEAATDIDLELAEEIVPEEETFEPRPDDIVPPVNETFEVSQVRTDEPEVEIAEEIQEDVVNQEEEEDEEEPWDGVHRSMEIQDDEDLEPVEELEEPKADSEEVVESTSEVQEEVEKPIQKKSPNKNTCFERQEEDDVVESEKPEEPTTSDVPKSPVARRSRTPSIQKAARTPSPKKAITSSFERQEGAAEDVEAEKPEEPTSSELPKSPPARRTRASSVQKSAKTPVATPKKTRKPTIEHQEEEEDVDKLEEPTTSEPPKSPARRTRASSVQKATKTSVATPKKTTKTTIEDQDEEEDVEKTEEPPKSPARRARASSVQKSAKTPVATPKKTRKPTIEHQEEDEEEEPTTSEPPKSPARKTRASSVQKSVKTPSKKTAGDPSRPSTSRPSRSSSRPRTDLEVLDSLFDTWKAPAHSKPSKSTESEAEPSVSTPKRGRPRKSENPNISEAERAELETPRTLRTRKSSVSTPATESRKRQSSESAETPVKRSRGRPPRASTMQAIPETDDVPTTSSAITPKRGRPRKN